MNGINKVTILGALGNDPEVKTFPNSDDVQATISVATSKKWTDRNTKEKKEKTSWHRIIVKGQAGKYIAQYAKSGDKVFVEGELQYRQYEDADTKKTVYVTEVVTYEAQIVAKADKNKQQAPAS